MHGRKKTGDLLSEDEQNAVTAKVVRMPSSWVCSGVSFSHFVSAFTNHKVSAYRKLSDKLLESRQALVGDGKAAMAKAQVSDCIFES